MPKQIVLAYLALISATAIWGMAGVVIKLTVSQIPPFTFLFYRFFLNSAIILPFFLFYVRRNPVNTSTVKRLIPLAIMGTVINLSLIFLGLERTTALEGTLIASTGPIFVIVGGVLLLKEKVTWLEATGIAVTLVGVAITIAEPALSNTLSLTSNITGNILMVLASISASAFVIMSREDVQKDSPFLIVSFFSFVGFLSFIPLSLFETQNPLAAIQNAGISAHLGVLYMSLLSSLAAYYLYEYGLKYMEASRASIFTYIQPVFTAPFALIFLGEQITKAFIAGAVIIAFGVILAEYKRGEKAQLPHHKTHHKHKF